MISESAWSFEEAIFQTLLPNLEAEGFQVFVHPSPGMLPPFLRAVRPDAVAMKHDRKVAIEVASPGGHAEAKLQRLQAIFSEHPDWELRVVYAPSRNPEAGISVAPKAIVLETLDRIPKIFEEAGPLPALLTAWSTFEAAARTVVPEHLGRPQQPARLLEILASDGYVTADEATGLRRLGRLRNEAAHGRLDIPVTRSDIQDLVAVTRTLLEMATESG